MMRKTFLFVLMLWLVFMAPATLLAVEAGKNPVCLLKTSSGEIRIELFARQAPETVKNFISLAQGEKEFIDPATGKKVKRPFYDNLVFHRVIKDFMIQGGCPLGNGSGGPGYTFEDEINANSLGLDKIKAVLPDGKVHPNLLVRNGDDFFRVVVMPLAQRMGIVSQEQFDERLQEVRQKVSELSLKDCYENLGYHYNGKLKSTAPERGVIAMANRGPDTNGSQFFINLVDTPWLAGKHTVFGKVIQGMEVVDQIGAAATDEDSKPQKAIRILSIRLEKN